MANKTNNQDSVWLINLISVEPENQEKLLSFFSDYIRDFMSKCKGFRSSTFYKSTDGKKIVVCGNWDSEVDFQQMVQTEEGKKMKAAAAAMETHSITSFYSFHDIIKASS